MILSTDIEEAAIKAELPVELKSWGSALRHATRGVINKQGNTLVINGIFLFPYNGDPSSTFRHSQQHIVEVEGSLIRKLKGYGVSFSEKGIDFSNAYFGRNRYYFDQWGALPNDRITYRGEHYIVKALKAYHSDRSLIISSINETSEIKIPVKQYDINGARWNFINKRVSTSCKSYLYTLIKIGNTVCYEVQIKEG